VRKAIALWSRRQAASKSSLIVRVRFYLSVYILTSVLIIGICCRWYLKRGVVDV
jgi:hypothetical protein